MADTNPNTPAPSPTPGNPTVDLAVNRLLNDSSVSSEFTNLEQILQKSASATSTGQAAVEASKASSAASISGQYGRAIDVAKNQGNIDLTRATESQRGFGTNTAVIRQITEDTTKKVNDLEQRKQELLLQNDAVAAGKIADLQFQALQFEQDAKQKAFGNLLSLAGLGLQVKEANRAERGLALQERSQNFQERSAINNIALQFGVVPTENDTLESITAKVAPFASEKQKLDIAKTRADIARAEAETAKAKEGLDFNLDPATTQSLASSINNLLIQGDQLSVQSVQAILGNITDKKGAAGLAKVQAAAKAQRDALFSPETTKGDIAKQISSGVPKSDILSKYEKLQQQSIITPAQFNAISTQIDKMYPGATKYVEPKLVSSLGEGAQNIFKFLYGGK